MCQMCRIEPAFFPLFWTNLIYLHCLLMFGTENFDVAQMVSRTGFPILIEFANPLRTMNDPKEQLIELVGCLNERG